MTKHFLKIFSLAVVLFTTTPFHSEALGDVLAPSSAGATSIAGVNWGTVTVTDYSINIIGAHLVPIAPLDSKTFKLEYGYGEYGQSPGQYARLDNDQSYIEDPPNYTFSVSIPAPLPNRNYYFNIREVVGNDVRDLGVYGYAMTNMIHSNTVYHEENSNSLRVHGQLFFENGNALMNTSINVVLYEGTDETTIINSAGTVTGGPNFAEGNGLFEVNFDSLTAGATYTVAIQSADGTQIYPSFSVVMDTAGSDGGSTATTAGNGSGIIGAEPSYDGLVSCGHVGSTGTLDECDFNDLIVTINRVINFLIFYIAFPIVALVAAWAGIKLLTSGGDPGAKKDAKEMFKKVIIGLVLALLCWIIVKLILMTLGYQGPLLEVLNLNSNYEALQ